MSNSSESEWQSPKGVTKGNFDYVRAHHIANNYDSFLKDDPLNDVDWQIIGRYLPELCAKKVQPPPIVGDFGCGTGRSLLPLIERGYRGVAIDLSIPMLKKLVEKSNQSRRRETKHVWLITDCWNAGQQPQKLVLVQSNLVELSGIQDQSLDHGVCMFSTLGMISGSENRMTFLKHARRVIKPDGYLIVHAHNVMNQLRHRNGIRWAAKSLFDHVLRKSEFGDRTATYRGVAQMYIHSFRRSEFRNALTSAGFEIHAWHAIPEQAESPPNRAVQKMGLDQVGWIAVCR